MASAFVVLPAKTPPCLLTSLSSYEILSVSETREMYDMYGLEGMTRGAGGGFGGGADPADLFAELFGGGMHFGFDFGQGRGPKRTKGQDSTVPYDVTLEDLYNGKTVKANLEKEAVCGVCKGCVRLPHYIVQL